MVLTVCLFKGYSGLPGDPGDFGPQGPPVSLSSAVSDAGFDLKD